MNPFISFLGVCRLQAAAPMDATIPFIRIEAKGREFIAHRDLRVPAAPGPADPICYEVIEADFAERIFNWPFGDCIELPAIKLEDAPPEHAEALSAKIDAAIEECRRAFNEEEHQAGGPIRAELVRTNYRNLWKCDACGGLAENALRTEVRAGEAKGFQICEACIEAGDVPARMLKHADALEARARERVESLRDIAPRLQYPSWAEYREVAYGEPPAKLKKSRDWDASWDVPF